MARNKQGMAAGVVLFIVAAAVVATGVLVSQDPPRKATVDEEEPPTLGARTVLVGAVAGTISEPGKPLYTVLLEGTLPHAATTATVLSDENCSPDRAGVSHCRNRLKLPDGTTMMVMHEHRMSDVPCLAPGESVLLRAA